MLPHLRAPGRRLQLLGGLLLLLATASAERVTDGEYIHYGFAYADCLADSFPEQYWTAQDDDRRDLAVGPSGLTCMPGHVGANKTGPVTVKNANQGTWNVPLRSADGSKVGGNEASNLDGFSLELWIRPFENTLLDDSQMVLASIGDPSPGTTTFNSGEQCEAIAEQPVSLRLKVSGSGCIGLEVVTAAAPDGSTPECADFKGGYEAGVCSKALTSGALQHVVVAMSSNLVDEGSPSPPRLAWYIDGEVAADSEGTTDNDVYVRGPLGPLSSVVPSALWKEEHVLRVGTDIYPGHELDDWLGEVYMLALYNRPLSADEVVQNYAASLGNSAPIATDAAFVAIEDTCSELPLLDE